MNLPIGSHSALAAFGNICAKTLVMPTTMTAQNGKTSNRTRSSTSAAAPCAIVGRKVVGNFAYITVRPRRRAASAPPAPVNKTTKKAKKAHQKVTLKVPLTAPAAAKTARSRPGADRVRAQEGRSTRAPTPRSRSTERARLADSAFARGGRRPPRLCVPLRGVSAAPASSKSRVCRAVTAPAMA